MEIYRARNRDLAQNNFSIIRLYLNIPWTLWNIIIKDVISFNVISTNKDSDSNPVFNSRMKKKNRAAVLLQMLVQICVINNHKGWRHLTEQIRRLLNAKQKQTTNWKMIRYEHACAKAFFSFQWFLEQLFNHILLEKVLTAGYCFRLKINTVHVTGSRWSWRQPKIKQAEIRIKVITQRATVRTSFQPKLLLIFLQATQW